MTLSRAGVVDIVNDCVALPAAILSGLTEPFVRGGSAADGSGLGLAIAATIAAQMGAGLEIASPVPGTERGFRARVVLMTVEAVAGPVTVP